MTTTHLPFEPTVTIFMLVKTSPEWLAFPVDRRFEGTQFGWRGSGIKDVQPFGRQVPDAQHEAVGDTVRRPITHDVAFRHDCLLHLEHIEFRQAPKFLGIDKAGREMLSFILGSVPDELGWYTDAQIRMAAALLRRFHDATTTMPSVKESGFEVACHNDWAPTNTVFQADEPIAMIDFDTARPGERLWDAVYSAFTWLDLGNDDFPADEQIRRLIVFTQGYGWSGCTVARLAVYALARQTALAASTRARGKTDIADWATSCANRTALNVVERLLPTGYA